MVKEVPLTNEVTKGRRGRIEAAEKKSKQNKQLQANKCCLGTK